MKNTGIFDCDKNLLVVEKGKYKTIPFSSILEYFSRKRNTCTVVNAPSFWRQRLCTVTIGTYFTFYNDTGAPLIEEANS